MDAFTAKKRSGRFARMCVEVDLDKPLLRGLMLKSSTGTKWQNITYEDIPQVCSYCMHAGHVVATCKRKADEMVIQPENLEKADQDTPKDGTEKEEGTVAWSIAIRTKRRVRNFPVDGNRNPANSMGFSGIYSTGKDEVGAPQLSFRKGAIDLGNPSQVSPPIKEKTVERLDGNNERRPSLVKDTVGKEHKLGKNRAVKGNLQLQGNKFEFLAVEREITSLVDPPIKESNCNSHLEPAHSISQRPSSSTQQAQAQLRIPKMGKQPSPSPTQPISRPVSNPIPPPPSSTHFERPVKSATLLVPTSIRPDLLPVHPQTVNTSDPFHNQKNFHNPCYQPDNDTLHHLLSLDTSQATLSKQKNTTLGALSVLSVPACEEPFLLQHDPGPPPLTNVASGGDHDTGEHEVSLYVDMGLDPESDSSLPAVNELDDMIQDEVEQVTSEKTPSKNVKKSKSIGFTMKSTSIEKISKYQKAKKLAKTLDSVL